MEPIASEDLVFEEVDGLVAFEAEHFFKQETFGMRAWHLTTASRLVGLQPDPDGPHVVGSSGGAYLEILPDSRWTHNEELIRGENFSNEPGKLAILSYKVHFNNPGRYHVWARVYSTGSEDNGIHFGLNGQWPESGQRWQTVKKRAWQWDSRQRTEKVHVGVPGLLYLDIPSAGQHVINVSMREDGTELDRILLTSNSQYTPENQGPPTRLKQGSLPEPFGIPENYRETVLDWVEMRVGPALAGARLADGDGTVKISGELKQWHKVTLDLAGPYAHEGDKDPNPFTDYRYTVVFSHESGAPVYAVPGYFSADGNAAETSAESGSIWRAHFSPDLPGEWSYRIALVKGNWAAIEPDVGEAIPPYHGASGTIRIGNSDKRGTDFRAKGRLRYVGGHHLQHAGNGEFFLKAGPDAPETILAYADFDGTVAMKPNVPIKSWEPHAKDYNPGDPSWKNGKGKNLIGALNYLASKGMNSFSFLPYNAGGDGDNVWPFVSRDDKFHYDCSKLDQWGIIFSHAQSKGIYLHFKLQETEIDDNRHRDKDLVPESLDGGRLGPERKLYLRELIARFGHNLALNWNLSEENTQSYQEQNAMAEYILNTDPYQHHIVVHTYPGEQEKIYRALLGHRSVLTGASLQNPWHKVHQQTLRWVEASQAAGKPWVVANDEQNPAGYGVPPDPGYQGSSGWAEEDKPDEKYNLHDIRKYTLWGNLMAGGAGVEYYFGYGLPENDLVCEDFRSRDRSWDFCRIALEFFRHEGIPFWRMRNDNALVGNVQNDNSRFCFAKDGEIYLVYLPKGGTSDLDLSAASGAFSVWWFNPRNGGDLARGSVKRVMGGEIVSLGDPPADPIEDWLVVVR
ncbi:MAG: DUF5060 domain-containing protein, partial [Opitutae bacterium]|nr:DUF5060 domain-containing protein [Opitutae bacterium]